MSTRDGSGTLIVRDNARPAPTSWMTGHRVPRPDLGIDDGAWASWTWDGATLTAHTCPHGSIPVYYAVLDDGFVISRSMSDVLGAGVDRGLDWDALAIAIRIGYFLGEETPFRKVRILPPAGQLRWSGGAPSVSSAARDAAPVRSSIGLDRAIDIYLDLVAAAVRRRVPHAPFVIPLSGGRDSRHILLELLRQNHRPAVALTSMHYLIDSSTDVRAAAQVAHRLNVPHEVIRIRPYSIDRQEELCRRIDFATFDHVWALTLAERLRPFTVSYDGLNGNVLFGRTHRIDEYTALAQRNQYDALVQHLLERSAWIDRYLHPDVRDALSMTRAADGLHRELRRYRAWPNPIQAFLYWNRTRRYTAPSAFGLFRETRTVFCPMDDADVVTFALSLPPEVSSNKELQTVALRRGFPETADLPFVEALWRDRGAAWYAGRARHLHRVACAASVLRRVATGRSRLVDGGKLARRAAGTWLLGVEAGMMSMVPPLTYLLALERLLP